MESQTLENILRERNRKLTFWLLGPVVISYFVLQMVLFSFQMKESQREVERWRNAQRDRIVQALFLQNQTDLQALSATVTQEAGTNRAAISFGVWNGKRRWVAGNMEALSALELSKLPIGMKVNFKTGIIYDVSALHLADHLQGYLVVKSVYDWKNLLRDSGLLLLCCLMVFLSLKSGVWVLIGTLKRTVVSPLKWMTSEIDPRLKELTSLSPISLSTLDLKRSPTEFIELLKGYNRLIEKIKSLREKEIHHIAISARVDLATQVAHDVRSPLAALSLAIEGLPPLPGKQKEIFLGVAKRIQEISEELLVSRVFKEEDREHPKENGPSAGANISELVGSIIEEKRIISEKKSVNFKWVSPIAEIRVKAHEADLKRALSNLIDNALQSLGARGEITLEVTTLRDSVCVSVIDNGRGIKKENLLRVWDEGVSVDKKQGHGLGLSFVKRVVESWGGRVALESSSDKGTKVSLYLLNVEGTQV